MAEHRGDRSKQRAGHAVKAKKGEKHKLVLERRVKLFVVRDRAIALGGTFVSDLAEFKKKVMAIKNQGPWTLILAIHGAVDHIAAQRPPDVQHTERYFAADLQKLFTTEDWIGWKKQHGPTHLVLTACQANTSLEGLLIQLLTRASAGQQAAQGLGHGCKPFVESEWPIWNGQAIRNLKQFKGLSPDGKEYVKATLKGLNSKWGYYGSPPVPELEILDYFFNEVPKGEWPKVAVGLSAGPGKARATDLPFWNRRSSPEFSNLCPAADKPPKESYSPGSAIPRP